MAYQDPFNNPDTFKQYAFSMGEYGFDNYRWLFENTPEAVSSFDKGYRKYEKEGVPSEWGL